MKGYLIVGLYENGQPGEIFINISREGSTLGGLLDGLAAVTSIALQNGVSLQQLVHKFAYQKFEPSGHSSNQQVGYAHSVVDYIFRWLGHQFIKDYKPEEDSR